MKTNKRVLKIIIAIFMLVLITNNTVFAEVTKRARENLDTIDNVSGIVRSILSLTGSSVMAPFAVLITSVAVILFVTLQALFPVGNSYLEIPFPDTIVFNTNKLLDANFINPNSGAIIKPIQSILANLYDSFTIIAVAVFTIAAMIIGIRLALSTIASEKAKYKKAIGNWITGIIAIVALKWLIAGMFFLNEEIVKIAYNIVNNTENMKFQIYINAVTAATLGVAVVGGVATGLPLIGVGTTLAGLGSGMLLGSASLATFVDGIVDVSIPLGDPIPGYLGLAVKTFFDGAQGSVLSSVLLIVILGQTISIVCSYIKRIFMCALLGIIGPLVVAIDSFNKSMGKQSTIFSNWLKQMALAIFTQTFHAIFMVIIIQLIAGISKIGEDQLGHFIKPIIIIILTTSLIKMEKVIKQLIGVDDALMGDLKQGATRALATVKSAEMAGKAVADNGRKAAAATANKSKLVKQRAELVASGKNGGKTTGPKTTMAPQISSTNNVNSYGPSNVNNVSGGNVTQTGSGFGKGDDEVKSLLRNISNQLANNNGTSREKEIKRIDEEIRKANADIASARLAQIVSPASVATGIGLGLGMDDPTAGALLTTGMDNVAEKIGREVALRVQKVDDI